MREGGREREGRGREEGREEGCREGESERERGGGEREEERRDAGMERGKGGREGGEREREREKAVIKYIKLLCCVHPHTPTHPPTHNKQDRDNQTYLSMIKRVLDTPGFYYSNNYDLTLSLQRRNQSLQTRPNFPHLSLYERADERFVWNAHVLRDLVVQPELRRFTVPVIHGFVSIEASTINGNPFSFVLISRRSFHRAGMWGLYCYTGWVCGVELLHWAGMWGGQVCGVVLLHWAGMRGCNATPGGYVGLYCYTGWVCGVSIAMYGLLGGWAGMCG